MVPGLSTGGGGIQSSSSASATSGNSGNTETSSADRVSKQFINIGTQGAAGLDLASYLQSTNAGFYDAIKGEQQAESGRDKYLPYVALAVVAVLGIGFMMKRGR